jgi:hypothetical protein
MLIFIMLIVIMLIVIPLIVVLLIAAVPHSRHQHYSTVDGENCNCIAVR